MYGTNTETLKISGLCKPDYCIIELLSELLGIETARFFLFEADSATIPAKGE